MKKAILIAVTLALCALIGPTLAVAGKTAASAITAGYRLSTAMTATQMTKPRPVGNVGSARGALVGVVTVAKSSTASWTLTFSGLTGQVTAAEVRYPAAGTVSVIRLCAPCANGAKLVTTFPSRAVAKAVVKQALAGKADVVLKTKRNRAGEVRGVIKAMSA